MDEWEKGQTQGVAIGSDGHLEPGPALKELARTPSTYIWSVAADAKGNVYAATGSPATVLRVARDGHTSTLLRSKDLTVQVVRVGPDGNIYAATLPSGKVYRLDPEKIDVAAENATVVFDPKTAAAASTTGAQQKPAAAVNGGTAADSPSPNGAPQYIWDLGFDGAGRLYVATGGPAAIYRVDLRKGGKPELFFSSDEQHIRSMLVKPDGSVLAGSDGDGLVYRIDPSGRGVILYNANRREITALAERPDGTIYAAGVGEKGKSSLPPLPVQGLPNITATITILAPGSVQASSTNSLVPDGSEVYELTREGAPRRLWAAHDDVIYALQWTPEGLLAGTGNRGRVYRVQEDGQYTDLTHVQAAQVTSFAAAPDGWYLATSNTGRLYRLGRGPSPESTYLSASFDAGTFAHWGRAEVDAVPDASYDLYSRSGNVSNPERNWSPWQKVAPGAASIGAPPARFLQWKAVLHPGARLNALGVAYLPANVAPVVDELVVQLGARVNPQPATPPQAQPVTINLPSASANVINLVPDQSNGPLQGVRDKTAVTARWAAHDDNGDELTFAVYYRTDDERNWQLLKGDLSERYYSFDAAQLPDGAYHLKIIASDAPSHPPGEALTGTRESERFVLDTTPPLVGPLTARMENGKLRVTGEARDQASPITHAEYSIDGGPWQYVEPAGKLSDALTERYDFVAPLRTEGAEPREAKLPKTDPGEHTVALRVYDRYENASSAKAVAR